MLEPQSRAVLLEALRPPEGFVVDRAIATTYTLDLTALLTAPLAFSLYDGLLAEDRRNGGHDTVEAVDPYALLKSVRGYAERLTVFCQVARIAKPPKFRQLLGYLEGSVVQVQASAENGVFHPKVWVLRFRHETSEEVKYRFLCLSRNLTFDRSWDTMLSLDGDLALGRTNAHAESRPLGDFVAALPELALTSMDPRRRRDVELIAEEVRRVKFEAPEGVEKMRFHPIGIEGYAKDPFADDRIERLLIVSPFVSEGALSSLTTRGREHVLVSRLDQLQTIRGEGLRTFSAVHVLDDAAEATDEEAIEGTTRDGEFLPPPTGLHAKLFVADDGWNAHVWTGSANATTAALKRNVEFLVQLTGKKSNFGVEAILEGKNGTGGLRPLLAAYTPPAEALAPSALERRLEERLQNVRTTLARVQWSAVVGESTAQTYPFTLHARTACPSILADLDAWPITLKENRAQRLRLPAIGYVADFGSCSLEALSSFIAFRVLVSEGAESLEETFVLNVLLEDAPEDRMARILQSLLDDPDKVLRFLQMLLATDALDVLEKLDARDAYGAVGASVGPGGSALLETLLRALDRDPGRIDSVAELVRDLSTTAAGTGTLPEGFMTIWEPIRAARASLLARGRT
jgi:hypothetical protein